MFRGHGNEISPATLAGFGPLKGPVIMLTLFEARVRHGRAVDPGMVHGRTASRPLLAARMPALTVAGDRLATSVAMDVYHCGVGEGWTLNFF